MADGTQLSPEELHEHAGRLENAALDMKAEHEGAHADMTSLIGKFGPATAAALEGLSQRWQDETKEHHDHMVQQGVLRRLAANGFTDLAQLNADLYTDLEGRM